MEVRTPPSKVLFIRDIPPSVSNEQFENLFQMLPGFVSIRRKPFFAFVEFKDHGYATSAMRRHNGYRHHPSDKPLVIDFDKDPRSRDDFSSSTSSSSTSAHYRDIDSSRGDRDRDRDRDRDLDSIRRGESRGSGSDASHHSSYKESRSSDFMDASEKDTEDSRYHDDDLDDTDRSDKHRPKRESDTQTHPSIDIEKKRPREFDRFEKDRGRYRDLYFDRDDYPMKRDFHSMPHHHTPPYAGETSVPYFLPSRPSYDMKDACSTLFVSNLPKDVTERELSILFRFMRGFVNVRLVQREGKYPICFCDFRDTPSAAVAMEMLNGFKMDPKDISSSISIEFDKSRTHRPEPKYN